jgi:hypothetical protein
MNAAASEGLKSLMAISNQPPKSLITLETKTIPAERHRIELLQTAQETGAGDQTDRIEQHEARLEKIPDYIEANRGR